MCKKRQCKNFICVIIVALMLLTMGDASVLGMKKVFAKVGNKDIEVEKVEEENIISIDEIENMEIGTIIRKIQRESIGISSIRIVNKLKEVEMGDEIEFEVHDELGQKISADNLVFTIDDEKSGKMDEEVFNKFIKMNEDTVVIKVNLKDRPNIKDEIRI